jgi:DNA-binding beta-propeller fold protein YncE
VGTITNDDCPTVAFLTKWGTQGTGNGQFQSPAGVAVDITGNVYVADTNNHLIRVIDLQTNTVSNFEFE